MLICKVSDSFFSIIGHEEEAAAEEECHLHLFNITLKVFTSSISHSKYSYGCLDEDNDADKDADDKMAKLM